MRKTIDVRDATPGMVREVGQAHALHVIRRVIQHPETHSTEIRYVGGYASIHLWPTATPPGNSHLIEIIVSDLKGVNA